MGAASSLKYNLGIQSPDDGKFLWPVSTGEIYIDHLRLKVLNYGESQPKVVVRLNIEDASNMPPQATLLTVGGPECKMGGKGFCEREFAGYKIRLKHRLADEPGVKLQVREPDNIPYDVFVYDGKLSFSPSHGLAIGGFFDRSHIMTGGYALLYVYTI